MDKSRSAAAQAADKIQQCSRWYAPAHTGFLDLHQRSLTEQFLRREKPPCRVFFDGGYDGAERVILRCLPEDWPGEPDQPLAVIRVRAKEAGGRPMRHGDYLGALMGLGLKRDPIGDILVREDGADIIVLREIAPFLLEEFAYAGHARLEREMIPLSSLIVPRREEEEIRATAASLRLDNILAAGFGISRAKAVEAIRAGLVFLDHVEVLKPDAVVREGMEITFRHHGRVFLTEAGGFTRKNRIRVTFLRK